MSPLHSVDTDAYRLDVVGRVIVCTHRRGPAAPVMAKLTEVLATQAATYPDGHGAVLLLSEGATPPDEDTRKRFMNVVREPSFKGLGVAVLGGGFWAATARSVVTFFVVVGRLPVRLYPDGRLAQRWVLERLGPSVDVHEPALNACVEAHERVA